ncbi:MAG: tRNA (adenosine(37)-N6)-threonylcarbamoyltransferase complex ATPase subunit type 1 TsaE, partial [Gammaproteobacteria bacterium]
MPGQSGLNVRLAGPGDTEALGGRLAAAGLRSGIVFLRGELGAGKTTLVRGFIRAIGHSQKVKSPTYTLLEIYEGDPLVLHLDLYRLVDPEELEFVGLRDYMATPAVWFVEWPDKGRGQLPAPDITVSLAEDGAART